MNIFHMILLRGGDSNGSSAMKEFFRDTLLCLFIEFTGIYKQNVSTCLPTICLSITIDECVCARQQKNCIETNMETIKQIKKIYCVFFLYNFSPHPEIRNNKVLQMFAD